MSDPAVLYEAAEHIATITLNRPDNRNSMTPEVLEGLAASVARARKDDSVRCVIVTGRGKSFCAGADFKSRGASAADAPPLQAAPLMGALRRLLRPLVHLLVDKRVTFPQLSELLKERNNFVCCPRHFGGKRVFCIICKADKLRGFVSELQNPANVVAKPSPSIVFWIPGDSR